MRLIPVLAIAAVLPGFLHADEKLAPAGGGFAIEFPGKPKEGTQTAKTAVGELKVYTATYATSEGSIFLASYTDFPAEAIKPEIHATLFDGIREGLKGKDGKVVSEERITIGRDEIAGREVVIEKEKSKQRTRFRVAIKGTRLFQFAAIGSDKFVSGKDAKEFLDSFEFTK
jgi:hypothetical protein